MKDRHYFHYADLCREQGVDVPVIPGLKILTSEKQLSSIPRTFYVEIPAELADEVMASPQHVVDIGVEWAAKQTQELLYRGVPLRALLRHAERRSHQEADGEAEAVEGARETPGRLRHGPAAFQQIERQPPER